MTDEILLPANNWRPRHYQEAFWDYMQKTPVGARAILCHHRRAGKDHTAINWAAVASQLRVGLYIHIFPYANQGRRVIWNGIDGSGVPFMSAFPNELVDSRSDLEMRLKLKNGSIFQVLGADDPDKLVGINCVGAIFSEFALMDPKALELVMPILNENGGWAIFPSTPRGENHFYSLCENAKKNPSRWFLSIETIATTGAVNPKLIDEERERGVEETLIQQEYFCSFKAPLQGSYYDKQMSRMELEKRITDVPHDPAMPVNTAWDLGVNDSCTIWMYQVQKDATIRVIDYYEATGEGFGHYAGVLDRLARINDWVFGSHYAPHDIMQRDIGTAKVRLDTAREVGIRFTALTKSDLDDGIEAVRQTLPRTWIDAKKCRRGIVCLKGYRKEWDERLKVYRNKPRHDEHSHGADAFRTLAMAERRSREKKRTFDEANRKVISEYNPWTH